MRRDPESPECSSHVRLRSIYELRMRDGKRDVDVLNRANTIYFYAQDNTTEFVNYGMDEATLTAVGEKIVKFSSALKDTEVGAAEKTATRQKLSEVYEQIDHVLYNMLDPLMEVFRTTHAEFYNQYVSARVVEDL